LQRLEGKVAVIAGGAGGIGTATSKRLASEGASVLVGDIDGKAAERVAAEILAGGGAATGFYLDLGDPGSIAAAFDHAVARFGGVDLLHCNGAALDLMPQDLDAVEIDLGIWDRILDVNLKGYLLCTRAAIPLMLARGGGAIVYTSSGASYVGEPARIAYGCAKAGINVLMRHVVTRWGREGIRANAIAPGLVQTPGIAGLDPALKDRILAMTPGPRLGEPEDIAAMVAMLLSGDAAWISGQTYAVDGGFTMR
jgi:NAD(P)-dependent dehydrogenase (short-subunit alcohol dehydrogenase family)